MSIVFTRVQFIIMGCEVLYKNLSSRNSKINIFEKVIMLYDENHI